MRTETFFSTKSNLTKVFFGVKFTVDLESDSHLLQIEMTRYWIRYFEFPNIYFGFVIKDVKNEQKIPRLFIFTE